MKIFLDDIRNSPSSDWILVRNVKDCVKYLNDWFVDEISLDHDLGETSETGYDVLLWIEEQVFLNNMIPPKIHIHTSNPSARKKMELAVKSIEKIMNKN